MEKRTPREIARSWKQRGRAYHGVDDRDFDLDRFDNWDGFDPNSHRGSQSQSYTVVGTMSFKSANESPYTFEIDVITHSIDSARRLALERIADHFQGDFLFLKVNPKRKEWYDDEERG